MPTTGPTSPMTGLSRDAPKRRWKLIVLLIVGFIALSLLALTVVVHLARGEIRIRITEAAARLGLEVEIGSVDIPVLGPIALSDLTVHAPPSATSPRRLVAELDRIETDITLLSAAGGQRRPDHVTVTGGRATLRWADGLVDLARSTAPSAGEAPSATTPLTLALADFDLAIEASQSTPAGLVTAHPFSVTGLTLALTRDADRQIVIEASGALVSAGASTQVSLRLDTRTQALAFESSGAEVHFTTPRGELALALSNLALGPDSGLVITDAGLALGDDRLAFDKLDARFARTLSIGLPDPLSIESLEFLDLRLARLPDVLALTDAYPNAGPDARLDIGKTHIDFAPSALLPTPLSATLTALSGMVRDPVHGQVQITSDDLTLGFADTKDLIALIALSRGASPLDALTRLTMARPTIDIRLTTPFIALPSGTTSVADPTPSPRLLMTHLLCSTTTTTCPR